MLVDFYICSSVTLIDREMAMKPTEKNIYEYLTTNLHTNVMPSRNKRKPDVFSLLIAT